MPDISEREKDKILKKLEDSGRIGCRTKSLTKHMDLSVDSRELARIFVQCPEVEPRDPETRGPCYWILSKNAISTRAKSK